MGCSGSHANLHLKPDDGCKMGYRRDGKNKERGLELRRQEVRDYESDGGGALMQVWRAQAEVGGENQSLVMLGLTISGARYQLSSHHVGIWVVSVNTELCMPGKRNAGTDHSAAQWGESWRERWHFAVHLETG